ncbi:MAG TPA: sugar ABC transporter substrate-binding protein [Amnibacterium sp.]|uniref:ABC transporter substrate-binding protein n=1 Tax=Amnibacterium sp. TaxID=1872496 RepID=UPI002F95F96B
MMGSRTRWRRLALAGATVAALTLSACSSGGGGGSATPSSGYKPGSLDRKYAGTTITVMMPPWGSFKKPVLQQFTDKTGIKVDMQTLAWDAIHDKVVTTEASGQAPADVVEMDWTWVSQFGAAGWFAPLETYLSKAQLQDSVGAPTFVQGGHQIGVPYSLDFRGTEVDMTMLKKAGVTTPPATWDDVLTDARAVKKAGVVKYPIGIPLKILEGTSTPWYALVRSSGGQILTPKGKPAFTSGTVGADALEFIHTAYSEGLIDPGAIGLTDQQVGDDFAAGQSAMVLSTGPGGNAQFTDPAKSKISKDQLQFTHVPGQKDATGPTVSLEEALSIPKASKHPEAAAEFITWWLQPAQLITAYHDPDMGLLPPSQTALQQLADSGKLADSKTILALAPNIQPVIPGGAPTWYSKFSAAAASTIQSVALGHTSASAGAAALAKQAEQFGSQG